MPDYPGITESLHLADWDPPFPVDLDRIRPQDEAYWQRYRTTPKAWLPLAVGQELWGHRLGKAHVAPADATAGHAPREPAADSRSACTRTCSRASRRGAPRGLPRRG